MTTKNNESIPEYCPIELTRKEMWEDEIHNYKEMIKYFQNIIESEPVDIKSLNFIDPDGNNIQAIIDCHQEFDDNPQESIQHLLQDIKNTKDEIANYDYWESNKETKKILQKATKQINKLIQDKIKIIKQEKPENIFTPLTTAVGSNFDYNPYITNSIAGYEVESPKIKRIHDEYDNIFEDDIEDEINEYVRAAERKSYIQEYEDTRLDFEDNWTVHEYYIEAFLSLPAEYIWTKYFHPLKNIQKYFGDDVVQIFHCQGDYDKHDPPALTSQYGDSRIMAWVRWYKVNILKRVGNFELVDPMYKKKVLKGRYKDGEMHGKVEEYYDGVLASIATYEFGDQTGPYQYFRPDGSLEEEGMVEKGSVISKSKIKFDEKGKPLNGAQEDWAYGTGNYLNGKRHGKFVKKNQKDEIVAVTNFNKGEKDGLHWQNDSSVLFGIKHKEVNYKNDELNGPYKYFNDHGQITHEGLYKNGKKHGESRDFYPSGRIKCVNKYVEGELRSWKDYEDK